MPGASAYERRPARSASLVGKITVWERQTASPSSKRPASSAQGVAAPPQRGGSSCSFYRAATSTTTFVRNVVPQWAARWTTTRPSSIGQHPRHLFPGAAVARNRESFRAGRSLSNCAGSEAELRLGDERPIKPRRSRGATAPLGVHRPRRMSNFVASADQLSTTCSPCNAADGSSSTIKKWSLSGKTSKLSS